MFINEVENKVNECCDNLNGFDINNIDRLSDTYACLDKLKRTLY